jgi:hypothetical protein
MARLAESPTPFLKSEFGLRTPFLKDEFGIQKNETLNEDIIFTPHQVFVLMPFLGQGMDEVYRAIKDGCTRLSLDAARADEAVGSGNIMRDFVIKMAEAEFLIFDLTSERPNVYYELGYAHGIGNGAYNILLIAKSGTKLHFDIAPLRVHFYSTLNELRSIVATNLARMARIYFQCPKCFKRVNAPKERIGQRGKCPACSTVVVIPASSLGKA